MRDRLVIVLALALLVIEGAGLVWGGGAAVGASSGGPAAAAPRQGRAVAAAWSPDGDLIAGGDHSDLSGLVAVLDPQYEPPWSPDGRRIVFSGERGILVIGADGKGKRQIVKGGHAGAWR